MAERRFGTVWIIGASTGIGADLAREIAAVADNVAISARSADKLETVGQGAANLFPFPVDVQDAQAVADAAAAIEERFGGIDLVVCCAAVWHPMSAHSMDPEKMRQSMDINYFGVVNAVNAVLPGMKARGSGHIVTVASVAGYRGLPTAAAYGPTKAALMHLTETLAIELRRDGIDVSLVNPGFVDTPMTQVNNYTMPGMIKSEDAARIMLAGIVKRKPAIFFPVGFTARMRLLNFLPYRFYYWLIRKMTGADRKN